MAKKIYTMKLTLRPDQEWNGKPDRGEKQRQMLIVAEKIISGALKVDPPDMVAINTLNCRFDYSTIKQLNKISANLGISTQELLRLGLEKINLLT